MQNATGPKAIFLNQGRGFLLLVLAWTIFILYIKLPLDTTEPPTLSAVATPAAIQALNFHLLFTASNPSPGFCKSLLSAAITGYPTPVLANWRGPSNDRAAGPWIEEIDAFLRDLAMSQDGKDLVLLIDGSETVMQLRAQTLVGRFLELAGQEGNGAEDDSRQGVVFGTRGHCVIRGEEDCSALRLTGDSKPAYLDPSLIVGTLEAMSELFEEALFRAKETDVDATTEQIFSSILIDQRNAPEEQAQRRRPRRRWRRQNEEAEDLETIAVEESLRTDEPSRSEKQNSSPRSLPITIDHDGYIFPAPNDLFEWVVHNSTASNPLPQDILNTPPPYWTFSHEPRLPSRRNPWSSVPLFTATSSNIPAIIPKQAWENTWLHNDSRILYDTSIYEPVVPISAEGEREFWPSERRRGGAARWFTHEEDWIPFEDLCNKYSKEILGDGRGGWVLPEVH